jgi:hypothetical protein
MGRDLPSRQQPTNLHHYYNNSVRGSNRTAGEPINVSTRRFRRTLALGPATLVIPKRQTDIPTWTATLVSYIPPRSFLIYSRHCAGDSTYYPPIHVDLTGGDIAYGTYVDNPTDGENDRLRPRHFHIDKTIRDVCSSSCWRGIYLKSL